MPHPVRDFLPTRRAVLNGAAATWAGAAASWAGAGVAHADITKNVVTGTMSRFKITTPPKRMPDLEFLDARDRPLKLSSFVGKTVLVNLWATWCPPCVKEMPSLDRLQAALPMNRFLIVPISLDGPSKPKVVPFYREEKLTNLGIYYDKLKKAMSTLDVTLLPTSILIDPDGREVGRIEGDADWDSPEGMLLLESAA